MSRTSRIPKFVLAVLLATGLTGQPEAAEGSQQAGGLTLDQAVNLALQNNPMLKATEAGIDVASAQLSEAKSGRYPMLSFSETYTNSNNPVFVFGSLLEQGRFGPSNFDPNFLNHPPSISNFRSSLNLKLPVFNRFQVSSGIRQAEIREGQAGSEDDWARQQIRLHVIQAYYGLILARQRQAVAEEAVRTAEAQVESIRAKVDTGVAVTSDLLAMQVQLADFQQQLVQARGDVETALAGLNTVLALPIDTPHALVGSLDERQFPEPEQSSLIGQALQLRPDYANAQRQVELAEQEIRKSKGQWYPNLNVFAQAANSTQDFSNGSGDFAVGASLNFDIVDLGRSSRIRQSVAAARAAGAQKDRVANQIRLEVVRAYQGYLSSRQRLHLAAAAVDQAVEALRIVEDRQNVGLTTVTEVLRAQTALLSARFNVLGARYDHYLNYAGILLSTGSLNDVSQFSN
jgi:outer membrane protein TolC